MNTMNCDQNCNLLDAKALGNWGEDIARQYIEQQGLKIVTTNYKTKVGEIDIIAKNGLTYHFIEIKARVVLHMDCHGRPFQNVNKSILNKRPCILYEICVHKTANGRNYPLM